MQETITVEKPLISLKYTILESRTDKNSKSKSSNTPILKSNTKITSYKDKYSPDILQEAQWLTGC
jgi:hypothetical protein